MCVLFEFRQFVFLLWELVDVFQSFVSIFAKKICSYEMSSGFDS